MIRAGVVGFGGRMGSLIARLILESSDISMSGALEDPSHPSLGRDTAEALGFPGNGIPVKSSMPDAFTGSDVIIDFTFPGVTIKTAEYAFKAGTAMVIGSTGFTPEEKERIAAFSSAIPIVLSPNMSIGVNVLFKIVDMAAKLLDDSYDAEIVEAHHKMKKDAPSGTALAIAQVIAKARGVDLETQARYERHGMIGQRPTGEIGIQTVRAGDIVGEHCVMFAGGGERIEISHKAHSRENFARGAIAAARWIVGKKPGLYTMTDVLGINDEGR